MFDLTHILYMLISGVITAILLIVAAKRVKTQSGKDTILKLSAVVTVALHYSSLWVDYLTTGSAEVENNQLFPIYPCNIIMWLLLIAAYKKDRTDTLFTVLSEFLFWGGIVCGSIGIIFNINYDNTPNLLDYDILKGLVSHSTMLFGCIYTRVGGYMRFRVFNVVSCASGLTLFLVDGMLINRIYKMFNLEPVNAMYLLESPFASMPWLSPIFMGVIGLGLLFAGLALYELRFPKEERWYSKLKNYKNIMAKEGKGE